MSQQPGNRKIILIVGTGTIGEPLTGLMTTQRQALGIDEIIFHKRTPLLKDRSKVFSLLRRGAKLAVNTDCMDAFRQMGMQPSYTWEEALDLATVVIDCTPVGNENKQRYYLDASHNTMGFIAQGSESGFGKPYARGINDAALRKGEDKFIQVVSCNTHNLATVLDTFVTRLGGQDTLEWARFLCMRRANDLSQDSSFLPSPEAGAHDDKEFGTHHARDVFHLYETLGWAPKDIVSSAVKLNTQYMHLIWFDVRLNRKTDLTEMLQTIYSNDRLAITHKTVTNQVFSFGRDHGHFGRILNQTVYCVPSLAVVNDGYEILGNCFTPQDGNSLLSSVSASLWLMDPDSYNDRIQCLRDYFFEEV